MASETPTGPVVRVATRAFNSVLGSKSSAKGKSLFKMFH